MEISKEQIKQIEEFVKSKVNSLDWTHTKAVRNLGLKIAKQEKADKEIIEVTCLLHNVGRHKGREKYKERGADMARKYLEKNNFDQRLIEEVIYCLNADFQIEPKDFKTIEAKIFKDADSIDKISMFGILFFGINNELLVNGDYDKAIEKLMEKTKKKLDRLATKTGKEMGKEKYLEFKKYLAKL